MCRHAMMVEHMAKMGLLKELALEEQAVTWSGQMAQTPAANSKALWRSLRSLQQIPR
jgi:hypothetical protein